MIFSYTHHFMATIPYDSMESWWTIRCKLMLNSLKGPPERFAKSIAEKPRFITATAKSLCWLIWSQAKKFQEVGGSQWKWFGIHATTQEISLKGQVRLIFHKSTMFVHSLACSQSSCWLMQWGWSRTCSLLIPFFTQIYVCTWNMEKASKTKQKYEDFPKMFRAGIRYHSCLKLSANKESSLPKIGAKTHMSCELVGFQDLFGCFQK